MKTVGIICEYNPLHNGHVYQIQQARTKSNATHCIAVMSGNYVQRGTPAIINKYVRTEVALHNGIDLVLELPTMFSTASAEYFATAAIDLMNKTNIVDVLCFGCEEDDLHILQKVAEFLVLDSEKYNNKLKEGLSNGLSFPKSRALAIENHFSQNYNITNILASPNNILAIEYLKALLVTSSRIKPLAVKRIGGAYNSKKLHSIHSSATSIREHILNKKELQELCSSVPYNPEDFFSKPLTEDDFSVLLYQQLITNTTYEDYFDVSIELSNRISNLLNQFKSFSQFASLLKTKNHTLTGINRALIHILLDVKKSDIMYSLENGSIDYLKILGFKKASSSLLTQLKKKTKLPIISKYADASSIIDPKDQLMLSLNLKADELYRMVWMNKYNSSTPNEYQAGIIINS